MRRARPDDGALRERLKALAAERRRFGYRRLHVLLRREGHAVNSKRVQRLYREEKLTVRRRGGRKRAMGERRPMEAPLAANQRWSLDFVSDQMTDGRRFRILTVVDNCTRECLALVADTSISGLRVARELDAIIRSARAADDHRQRQRHGADLQRHPELGRPDQGRLALHRARQAPAERLQSRASTARLRDELLNETLFRSLGHARGVLEAWRRDYNEERPHSKLGWLTPGPTPTPSRGEAGRRRCATRRLRAPASCHPPPTRLRSRPDSRYDWMRNGGHVKYYRVQRAQARWSNLEAEQARVGVSRSRV